MIGRVKLCVACIVASNLTVSPRTEADPAPEVAPPISSRFRITASTPSDVFGATQMAWGPNERLYVTSFNGNVASYAFDAVTGLLSDRRDTGVPAFGLGFATHTVPGDTKPRPYLYAARNINYEGSITRLSDDDSDGIWGEPGETNVDIVRGVPVGDHTLDHVQIRGSQLFVGIGTRTNNGRIGNGTGQNFHDEPDGPVFGGFAQGSGSFTLGETSYSGAIGTIRDLSAVPSVTSAAQLRDGPGGTTGNLLAGRTPFLPGAPTAQLPYTCTADDKLVVHSAGTRNPFGLAINAAGELWFTNNYGRADTNGDGTSEPHPLDALDSDLSNDVHDQLFRAVAGGDYRYDNANFRSTKGFPTTPVVSTTFDNLDAARPGFGALHDPANPDGLGTSSSSNGLDFGFLDLTGFSASGRREYAVISRWTDTVAERPPGTDVLEYRDVVVVDPATGYVRRLASGFANPIDVVADGHGGFLVADWGFGGRIWRIAPRSTASHWAAPAVGGAWSDPANWSGGPVPDGVGAMASFVRSDAGTSSVTITLDGPRVLGTLNFDAAGPHVVDPDGSAASLRFAVDAGVAAINVIRGGHTLAVPLELQAPTEMTVAGNSTLTILAAVTAVASDVRLSVNGDGTVRLLGTVDLPELELTAGRTMLEGVGGRVQNLAIAGTPGAPTATLDVTGSALVVDYDAADPSPIAAIAAWVSAGHAADPWTGFGIVSSDSASGVTAVGFAESTDVAWGVGLPPQPDNTAILLRLTRFGDADLNGRTDLADFARLSASFNQPGFWAAGDFSHDGVVGIADFSLLAANFNQDFPARLDVQGTIPDPVTGWYGLIVIGASTLWRCRKSDRHDFSPSGASLGQVAGSCRH